MAYYYNQFGQPYFVPDVGQQHPTTPINTSRSFISGRLVNDVSEITPQEVPMDMSVSLFPKSDYSCIYAKCWDRNGGIKTFKFVPEQPAEEKKVDSPNDIYAKIDERLSAIEKMLKRTENTKTKRKYVEEDRDVQSSAVRFTDDGK